MIDPTLRMKGRIEFGLSFVLATFNPNRHQPSRRRYLEVTPRLEFYHSL